MEVPGSFLSKNNSCGTTISAYRA